MSARPAAVARHRYHAGLRVALRQSHNKLRRHQGPWFAFHAALARRYALPCSCAKKDKGAT